MMYFVQKPNIKSYFKNKGMSLAEYGLIMGLVVIVAIPALTLMGNQTKENINQVSQNSNQLNDMVNVLNAPVNGGTADQSNTKQENAFVNPNSSPLSLGGQNFGYQIGSDGKIRFTAQSGNATNTTAVEGGQMTQKILAELQQILNNPSSDLSEDQKEDLKELIEHAQEIANAQNILDGTLSPGAQERGLDGLRQSQLNKTFDATKDLRGEALDHFQNNPQVMLLSKTIATIAKQNYLENTQFSKNSSMKTTKIFEDILLTNISKEANHTDTQAATNQLETLNTASGG